MVEICEDPECPDYGDYGYVEVTEVLQWIVGASLRQSAFAAKQTKRRPTRYVFGTGKVDIQPLLWTGHPNKIGRKLFKFGLSGT